MDLNDILPGEAGSVPGHPGGLSRRSSSAAMSIAGYSWFGGDLGEYEDPEFLPPPPPELLEPHFVAPLRALSLSTVSSASPSPPPPAARRHSREPPTSVALPPFRTNRPAAWFATVEDIFTLKGIHDQRDRLTMAVASFPEDQLQQIDDILELRPRPLDIFNRVRDRLVSSHSLDDFQRLEQLMDLPPLGGQRPSALLAQMRQLCPNGEETTLLFRSIFLRRLPAAVRMQLAEDRYSPVAALAARADKIMVHHSHQLVAAAAAEADDPVVAPAITGGRPGGKKEKRKEGRRPGDGPPKPWKKMGICYQHYTFGAAAQKCGGHCSWVAEN